MPIQHIFSNGRGQIFLISRIRMSAAAACLSLQPARAEVRIAQHARQNPTRRSAKVETGFEVPRSGAFRFFNQEVCGSGSDGLDRGFLLPHDRATLHYEAHVLDGGDVFEGVAGDGDDIGKVA